MTRTSPTCYGDLDHANDIPIEKGRCEVVSSVKCVALTNTGERHKLLSGRVKDMVVLRSKAIGKIVETPDRS